ncbi:MAG: polysaccharide biosynthesis C-terminal domain-containing protein, partial [Ignavibacteria bacterium]
NIIYIYGMDSAYLKFAAFKDIGDDKDNFSTPYISIFISSVVFSIVIISFKDSIAGSLGIPEDYGFLIYLAAAIIFLDANGVIPFLNLRLDRKATKFTIIKISNIGVHIVTSLFLILVLEWGIEAILISNIAGSLVALLLLIPIIVKNFKFDFHTVLFKRLVKFGLPYLPAGMAVMVVQVIDVPILQKLTSLKTVGIYKANYKLGIFMMLFVNMFQYAWQPFFLQNAKEENAKQMFSKILTYFTLVSSILVIGLSLFIADIAKIQIADYSLIGSAYWSGLNIVPIILFAYLINGIYVIFSAGIYIEEKSLYVPFIAGAGAVINIVANFSLIPVLGIYGAALATFISYLIMAIGYYAVTQKFYHINYEWDKILKIFTAVLIILAIYFLLPLDSFLVLLFVKLLLLTSFIFYLYFFAIDRKEIKLLKEKLKESGSNKNA